VQPLIPLAGGFIMAQPLSLTVLSSTGVNVFTGHDICKHSWTILNGQMHYSLMVSSFLAVGVTEIPANQKLWSHNFKIFIQSRPYPHNSLRVSISQPKWSSFHSPNSLGRLDTTEFFLKNWPGHPLQILLLKWKCRQTRLKYSGLS